MTILSYLVNADKHLLGVFQKGTLPSNTPLLAHFNEKILNMSKFFYEFVCKKLLARAASAEVGYFLISSCILVVAAVF